MKLAELSFRKRSPWALAKAAHDNDCLRFHRAAIARFADASALLNKLCGQNGPITLWGCPARERDADPLSSSLVHRIFSDPPRAKGKCVTNAVEQILVALDSAPGNDSGAVHLLAAAELMVRFTEQISADRFSELYVALAQASHNTEATCSIAENVAADKVLHRNLVCGQVPFVLSLVLSDLSTSRALRKNSVRYLGDSLEQATDTDGTPHARFGRNITYWMSSFAVSSIWARAFGKTWGTDGTLARWKQAFKRCTALIDRNGIVTEFPGDAQPEISLLDAAVKPAGFSRSSSVATTITSFASAKGNADQDGKKCAPVTSQSDWAQSMMARSRWGFDADVLSVGWDHDEPPLGLAVMGSRVFAGEWISRMRLNGQSRGVVGAWECTCWFDDDEVSFVELERKTSGGICQVRQVMLALKEHFALLTDTVSSQDDSVRIDLTSAIPVAGETEATANTITRDLEFHTQTAAVRVVPLWLPDDRIQSAVGEMSVNNSMLSMEGAGRGAVSLPLLLDWHPDRRKHDADWNALTVTARGRVVSSFEAAGFRVRIGSLQLLIYHSLQAAESLRAVLGHHTDHETVIARIENSGSISPLVMVE